MLRITLLLVAVQSMAAAQILLPIPNPTPNGGANNVPFSSDDMTYVLVLRGQDLDPMQRRITDISFIPTESGPWSAPDFKLAMGHIVGLPQPSTLSLPVISQGVATSSGDLLDVTPLFDSEVDGPFSFTWNAQQFSPLNLPAQGGRSFVWDGVHDVAVYLTWQNALRAPGVSGAFASGDTTMVRYWRAAYQPSSPDQWGSFGMVTRIAAQPADPVTVPLGVGCAGTGGLIPILDTNGQLPSVGNGSFELRLEQVPAGSLTYLYAALKSAESPVSLGGACVLHIDLDSLLLLLSAGISPLGPQAASASGESSWPLPLSTDPSLSGVRLAFQAVAVDSASPIGWTASNGLDVFFN